MLLIRPQQKDAYPNLKKTGAQFFLTTFYNFNALLLAFVLFFLKPAFFLSLISACVC